MRFRKSKESQQGFFDRLRSKYRLVIYRDDSYEEVWGMRLSRLNFLVILGIFMIVVLGISWFVIVFTPIRQFIPGYTNSIVSQQVVANALRADSLAREMDLWSKYLANLRVVMAGGTPETFSSGTDSVPIPRDSSYTPSPEDSLLRVEVEQSLQIPTLASSTTSETESRIGPLMPPLRGEISAPFDLAKNHIGIDIIGPPDAPVSAIAEGTVAFTTWDQETGYTIAVQHRSGLMSIYKHNRKLLKKVDERVKPGDAIAIIGNSGRLTTGPHLHLELWYQGRPLNPQNYINF